jgi:hypothetical protein
MSLIIFYPFAMPWGCVWWHKTFWQKQWSNSDATVMEQWWNSDAFDLRTLMSFAWFWDVIDHILFFCNALGCVWWKKQRSNSDETVMRQGCVWWHKTIWKKQWSNSDESVMEQWCNSDRTVMPLIWALKCHLQALGPSDPSLTNTDVRIFVSHWVLSWHWKPHGAPSVGSVSWTLPFQGPGWWPLGMAWLVMSFLSR